VPSLRERDGDLYVLVGHFLRELTPPACIAPTLTPRAWNALTRWPFGGNVRELVWVLEHALARADGSEIDVQHLPDEVTEAQRTDPDMGPRATSPW
jgi:DNA-binding NtrC family response regulator